MNPSLHLGLLAAFVSFCMLLSASAGVRSTTGHKRAGIGPRIILNQPFARQFQCIEAANPSVEGPDPGNVKPV